MSRGTTCDASVEFLTAEDAALTFDRLVRRAMGIPTEEFLRRWDAGEWAGQDPDDIPGLVDVLMVLPLAR